MSNLLCACCKQAPRKGNDCYCADCRRAHSRNSARRTRGNNPRKQPWRPLKPDEKFCPRCNRILDKTEFSKNRGKKDGLMSNCKRCDAIKQMIYQNKNRKRLRPIKTQRMREYRAANPGYNARSCALYHRRCIARKLETLTINA